ncbi:HXXEE domain-containing protein [Azorhizobium doebereinerae]|uniref:HXXEE domain-containing protein n=1 Tax=Azorhizobium doebereinerae TaxID=281091 RepID=UPI000417EA7C|nr:HXXEE domain-containing protein [Azorhizobium doebereinerae]
MPVFAIIWPWIGLGAAAALLIVLVSTDGLQADRGISRWHDLPWLVWLGLAAYLLHQFEEHGIDLLGQPYAFRTDMCRMLGYRDPIACPVPLSFITAVNVGSVWGAGLLSALAARRWPAIGLSFFAVPLVNAFVHVGVAMAEGRYNPGLLTAVLFFLPLSLWTLSVAVTRAGLPRRVLLFVLAGGIAVHVILMGSLQAYLRGFIGLWPLNIIQVLNAFVPAALMYAGMRVRKAPPPRRKPNLRAV